MNHSKAAHAHSQSETSLESQPPHRFPDHIACISERTNEAGLPLEASLTRFFSDIWSCTHQNAEVGFNEHKLILTLKRQLEGYAKRLHTIPLLMRVISTLIRPEDKHLLQEAECKVPQHIAACPSHMLRQAKSPRDLP